MSAWNDLSDREKLEWLRARIAQIENTLGAVQHNVDEIGTVVKDLEAKQQGFK